jgi:hypothetical protein
VTCRTLRFAKGAAYFASQNSRARRAYRRQPIARAHKQSRDIPAITGIHHIQKFHLFMEFLTLNASNQSQFYKS